MKKHFVFLLMSLFAFATLSYGERLFTSLDVLRPAKISFPTAADKILIINNSPVQPRDYGHRTEFFDDKARNVVENADSLSIFCVSALAEELSDKYFFKSVVLHQNSTNKSNVFFSLKPLPVDTIKKLCQQYNTNVVLALDRIKVIDAVTDYFINDQGVSGKPYVSTIEAKYETVWSVYYPPESPNRNSFILRDTLYWENEAVDKRLIHTGLPKRYDALIDGALYTGRNTVNKLVPWWDKVDRYFFTHNSAKMKQAMDSVYVKNWTAAIEIWKEALNTSRNNSVKALAANNIAVCYEITNDVESAIKYAQEALSFVSEAVFTDFETTKTIADYISSLSVRKEEIEILKEQLGD